MEPVAVHAYLSTNVPAYSAVHYIIAFDKVVTNVGNGYHSNLGTFITPRSGLCLPGRFDNGDQGIKKLNLFLTTRSPM